MHFDQSLPDNKLSGAIIKAVSLGTRKLWEGNISKFRNEARRNPFALYYFAERYEYELAMAEVLKFKRTRGRLPDVASADAETMRLYSFAAMLSNVYDRLPPEGQKTLVGRVKGGLQDDIGLWPLAYEFMIASQLMQKGVNVEFRDWGKGGFDFLARRGAVEAEVECKTFSADVGRKIHRLHHYQLGGLIHESVENALDQRGSIFVDTVIPDRLDTVIPDVAKNIRAVLESGTKAAATPFTVTLHKLSPAEIPFDPGSNGYGPADISEFVEKRFNCKNPSMLVMARAGRRIAILSIRSARRDEVTGAIYKQLKRGATQFSGTRPAFLCAHMLDMRSSEIRQLYAAQQRGEHSGLNLIATRLFKGDRPHLHSLLFSAPGLPRKMENTERNVRRRHHMESGLTFTFTNPDHPGADDPTLKLFS